MTILPNFAPIFFLALFILIHFIYKGLKNIKNNKKIIESKQKINMFGGSLPIQFWKKRKEWIQNE